MNLNKFHQIIQDKSDYALEMERKLILKNKEIYQYWQGKRFAYNEILVLLEEMEEK